MANPPAYDNKIPDSVPITHRLGPLNALINNQHEFVKTTLAPAQNSPTSLFIDAVELEGGNADDLKFPLIIHCPLPAGQSRHAIFYIKPSIPERDFNYAVNVGFQIIRAGHCVTRHAIKWMDDNPFTNSDLAAQVGVVNYPHQMPTFEQNMRMCQMMMNGVIDLWIHPLQEALKCVVCRHLTLLDQEKTTAMHYMLSRVQITCEVCFKEIYEPA